MIKLDQLALSPYAAVGPDHFSVYEWWCEVAGRVRGRVCVWYLWPRDVNEPVGSGQGDHPEPSPHQHQDGGPPEQAPDTDDSLDAINIELSCLTSLARCGPSQPSQWSSRNSPTFSSPVPQLICRRCSQYIINICSHFDNIVLGIIQVSIICFLTFP